MDPTLVWKLRAVKDPMILASASPRRAAILRALGLPFDVVPPGIEENDYGPWDSGQKLNQRAIEKAVAVQKLHAGRAVLSADTIVRIDQDVLGKPKDPIQAEEMLRRLAGRWHEVWSALCFIPPHQRSSRTALCSTKVLFHRLTTQEIQTYVMTGEPLDKAGAYGIQGLGGLWVKEIQGCYFNVVGLPVSRLWELLSPA